MPAAAAEEVVGLDIFTMEDEYCGMEIILVILLNGEVGRSEMKRRGNKNTMNK